jgi:hypothetical protein
MPNVPERRRALVDHPVIAEQLAAVTELARYLKAAAAGRPDPNLPAQIAVYRGLDPVAIVMVGHHERDVILSAAHVAAWGFGPDVLALLIETWCAQDDAARANPLTGQAWGPGEMQDAVQNHGALEKGWISDALMVTVHNRAGDIAAASLPYRIVRHEVVWGEPLTEPDRLEGFIPEVLTQIMDEPDLTHLYAHYRALSDAQDLTNEELRDTCDVLTAGALIEHGHGVLLRAEPGSSREQMIRDDLGPAAHLLPRQWGGEG